MGTFDIREPVQRRSIEKKEKIIKAGFDLICEKGYYNIDTAKIAKSAGVSTGIVYQYFKDKHDIFIAGLEKYSDNIFYPKLNLPDEQISMDSLPLVIKKVIDKYIENHKLSLLAHEEIMAMVHSDKDVAYYFYQRELDVTYEFSSSLKKNGFDVDFLNEKVHVIIGMIDNLCHEIVYHKHHDLDYNKMTDIVITSIVNLLK